MPPPSATLPGATIQERVEVVVDEGGMGVEVVVGEGEGMVVVMVIVMIMGDGGEVQERCGEAEEREGEVGGRLTPGSTLGEGGLWVH